MRLRKNQSAAIETSSESGGAGLRRGRSGRGWGPFSGGQITVIILAVVVMVGLPVGAFAVVSGSNVFVTDATSGKHATVNPGGQMLVAVKAQTAIVTSGSMTVAPFSSATLFSNKPVGAYGGVRLLLGQTGASPTSQSVNVLSSVVPYVVDSFVMDTADISRFYAVPGVGLSLTVTNGTADPAAYTWRVYGRSD
jgi:hypothetical protein